MIKSCILCHRFHTYDLLGEMKILNNLLSGFIIALILVIHLSCTHEKEKVFIKPNFLLLMSDNQSWNHLGCYGDSVVQSPAIDKLARTGIRFTNAYCAAPSCTPARASMLTGQDIWRLEEGANLWGTLPSKFDVYTDLLEEAGYLVGMEGKGWGPGNYKEGGWNRNPGGETYKSFEEFYKQRKQGQPFCYWFSSRDPHRPYKTYEMEKDPEKLAIVQVPPYLPDNKYVRADILDYYAEIENFDHDVAKFIDQLNQYGQQDSTLIVVCSDNGWQMPRGLANLYDFGTRIPLIILMPKYIPGNRVVDDFVSLSDLAPTFLELAGLPVPDDMTAKSLLGILHSKENGVVDAGRDFLVMGRERHAYVRMGGAGYGGRSIRTNDFLLIRNFESENWPAGDPPLFGDVDAHMLHYPSPTKLFMLQHRNEPEIQELFRIAFDKRPEVELYDQKKDPFQMNNVAGEEEYADIQANLAKRLEEYLIETGDPRKTGGDMKWIGAEYYATRDFHPVPNKIARDSLGLKNRYSYLDE